MNLHEFVTNAMQMPISTVRFVAVSATIPNVSDIAEWLNVPTKGLRVYGEEMRPCKLKTVVRLVCWCVHPLMGDQAPCVILHHCGVFSLVCVLAANNCIFIFYPVCIGKSVVY